ncbi:vitamin B12-dependent ribonucleotide reductase [bacterium]|nr:vitamin B12-dependent ribonucleotide reductase [bacterium]NIN92985.1 vitamin B12-dependent ribonucleotide reductase [bacterium]NIO19049.1 vitamin B12-dependent ribonucleotide reductase [bacterium]NIO74177.1 vitamin B12-dependent ribonucleotide reductase [bacterium]
MARKIRKRDGRIVNFDRNKITRAIEKSILAVKAKDRALAERLSRQVMKIVKEKFVAKIPGVEDIQDIVENVLIGNGLTKVAKAYILYRQKRKEVREAKGIFGIEDDLKLPVNAVRILEKRYLLRDESGNLMETPKKMFHRVAREVARADRLYGKKFNAQETEKEFYKVMSNLEFIPNSPTLINAGTRMGQLSACFVLPVKDSMKSIFEAVKDMALIHQSGGGTGFSFSKLRPKGDLVKSTKGIASGPVSFMRVFDMATDIIKQGGRRRGANMGILRIDHPDILEFITAKTREGAFANFNLSVAITDKFMRLLEADKEYELINPRTERPTRKLRAKDVFSLIVATAWKTGDPGLVFIDRINKKNPTSHIGVIESTNPCAEQPLLPYESCVLGSINLSKMVKEKKINWKKLREVIRTAIHFLDNVIDVNKYPLPSIERMTKGNRKIGLGVMGFAEMLIKIGIPYDSRDGIAIAEEVMRFISREAREKSKKLAKLRGVFLNFKGSIWDKKKIRVRNACLTTIAPTGTISTIAGCSSGIEPLFAISYVRRILEGTEFLESNGIFEEIALDEGFYDKKLMMEIAKKGSIQHMKKIPQSVRRLFVTAFDISPEWHVRMQAAFQKYTDNAVSKTVNLPYEATVEEVEKVYKLAFQLGCKGVTVYRYGSKSQQVLYLGPVPKEAQGEEPGYVSVDSEYAGGCPAPYCLF